MCKSLENNTNGFNVFHLNIRSLRKHYNELLVLLNNSFNYLHIIILTEINIKQEEIDLYPLPGYENKFAYTRESQRGGGIIIFAKSSIQIEFEKLQCTVAYMQKCFR